MNILGVHDGHNASAVLLRDGKIIAGVQEERCRGVKNAMGMPKQAIRDVLEQAGIGPKDVDFVALSGLHSGEYLDGGKIVDPSAQILKWHERRADRNSLDLKSIVRPFVPKPVYELLKGNRLREARFEAVKALGFNDAEIRLVEHHTAHAASAYFGWGRLDEPILVLTNDGMGDDLCATVNIGKSGTLERIAAIPHSESVAEVYALTTFLMGMVPLEHEYKLMGMAPYASPEVSATLAAKLAELFCFDKHHGLSWHRSNGLPPVSSAHRHLENIYRRRRFDHVCGGLQTFVEDFLKRWVANAIADTGIHKIALSGGIFMNVKANKLLLEMEGVDEIFVFPSCGDESNAVGAAYWIYAEERRKQGRNIDIHPLGDVYWGKSFSDAEIEEAISKYQFSSKIRVKESKDIEAEVAALLAQDRVVARVKGRMEFGARALGNRSILANPGNPSVVRIINEMIKMRDFWMPFAPSVKQESAARYIKKPKDVPAPYMILCFDSVPASADKFIAGIHPYDGTARPQEVTSEHNECYHRLIDNYGERTGEEIILNTSFNIHGFPIAYTPEQSLGVLNNSGLRHLAIGNFLLTKSGC